MFKSSPMSMIQNNMQMSTIRLSVCYQYKTSGAHTNAGTTTGKSPIIEFYGINKTGDQEFIASGDLATTSAYVAEEYAATTIIGMPTKEYAYIYWTYDSNGTDLLRISAKPELNVEVRECSKVLDTDIYTKAEIV